MCQQFKADCVNNVSVSKFMLTIDFFWRATAKSISLYLFYFYATLNNADYQSNIATLNSNLNTAILDNVEDPRRDPRAVAARRSRPPHRKSYLDRGRVPKATYMNIL
jgi:hypothetical protein